MQTPSGRRGKVFLVASLLLVSIIVEQYLILPLMPWLSQLGGIRPMFVFLDIPVQFPVVIDWIPVSLLFILLCVIAARNHLGLVFGRWCLMPVCMLIGGGLYYLVSDQLPKQVRNGIDSFGLRADVVLPYPSEETIHLQGSMIILVCCSIGWWITRRRKPTPAPVVEYVHPEQQYAAEQKKLQMRIPEPVAVREQPVRTPPPSVAVQLPRRPCARMTMPGTRKNDAYPCVVSGQIKPAIFREKDVALVT